MIDVSGGTVDVSAGANGNITLNLNGATGGTYHIFSYGTLVGTPSADFTITGLSGASATWTTASVSGINYLNLVLSPVASGAVLGSWQGAGGGSWTSSSWTTNPSIPGGTNQDTATFGPSIAVSSTITLDGSRTLAGLGFSNAGASYTLSASSGDGSTLTLANTGTASASLSNSAGSHTISVPVVLGSNLSVTAAANTTLTVNGHISDNGSNKSLSLSGGGTLILAAANSYSGSTTISNGTLQVGEDDNLGLPPTTALLMGTFGTLRLTGNNCTVATLSGSVGSSITQRNLSNKSSLTVVPSNGSSTTFAGSISDGGATGMQLDLAGTGPAGTLNLTGTNTYTGGTVVSGGTLAFVTASSMPSTGLLTVSNGGWVTLGDSSGISSLVALLGAKSPLSEAAAPSLASTGLATDAGLTQSLASSPLIPNPPSPIPASYVFTAEQAGSPTQAAAVPEPGTLALLLAAALGGLAIWRRLWRQGGRR
jgi:autotransporter-associated beta strand protein